MHLASEFLHRCIHKFLSEACRATIVYGEHGITAVRHPLVPGIIAIGVPRPWPTVDGEHHRDRLFRAAITIRIRARWQGEIGDQIQTIARLYLDRLHGLQRRAVQVRPRGKHLCQRTLGAVIDVIDARCIGGI